MSVQTSSVQEEGSAAFKEFLSELNPIEAANVPLLTDYRTGARYCECHVKAAKLVMLSTTDAPLDPEEQGDYRANREIVENAPAYARMKDDAKQRWTFSNIVTEYTKEFEKDHPLKIIGGQHRFEAIKIALESGVDELHGVKVYFDLNMEQRLDVQLISNTNIAISRDLFDRMHETVKGPQLREWAQSVGLLPPDQDFADSRTRGGPISVQLARTFIVNYFAGAQIDPKKFDTTETTPSICASGAVDSRWESLRDKNPSLWKDPGLKRGGEEFAKLMMAQRAAFSKGHKKPVDYPEKASSPAILAAWAYVAGMLTESKNQTRLSRHYALSNATGHDPLNVSALVKGRHKTDPEQYRGLGYRNDPKERGRFSELFFIQAESGQGITKSNIDLAIAKYHAKIAALEVQRLAGGKGPSG